MLLKESGAMADRDDNSDRLSVRADFGSVFGRPEISGASHIAPYVLLERAASEGNEEEACRIVDQIAMTAGYSIDLIAEWCVRILRFLADRGLSPDEIQGISDDLRELVNRPLSDMPFDAAAEWLRVLELKSAIINALATTPEHALRAAREFMDAWRSLHDRNNDYICGLLNVVHVRFGEQAIETLYRDYVIGDFVEAKYGSFGQSPEAWRDGFDRMVAWTFSGVQLHLFGPARDGQVEFREFDDRVEFSFDPCGNGGRMMRGEKDDGSDSRLGSPYFYKVIEGAYDFTWNKKGVCHYCVHCNLILQKMPIEKFGFPLRVVSPPTHPDRTGAQCVWKIYRSVELVPEEAYLEVGETPPTTRPGARGRLS